MKKLAVKSFFLILIFFFSSRVNATLTIVAYDTTNYPNIATKFFILDQWNRIIPDAKQADFTLLDNSSDIKISKFTSTIIPEEKSSIVVCFDLSIGQRTSNTTDFNYAKSILNQLLSFIDTDNSETALLSFDQISIIESDFTSETNTLATMVDNFSQSSSSNIFRCLTSLPVGGLEFTAGASYANKSILLITQNLLSKEEAELIVSKAKENNIRINILYISDKIPTNIQYVADMTGGYAVSKTFIEKKRLAYLATFAKLSEAYVPYVIEGRSLENCSGEHIFAVSHKDHGSGSFEVKIQQENLQYFEAEPQWLDFSSILPGTKFEKSITFTAKNSKIEITGLELVHPNFSIKSISPGVPISLNVGESIKVSVEFAPQDSSIVFAQLVVHSNACAGDTINITGGFPNIPPKKTTVDIINPQCNEILIIGDTMEIHWTGLLPKDVVQLEYAYGLHAHKKWDTLAKNVTNLTYKWPVPNIETDSFRIKLIQLWPNNVYKTFDLQHDDFVNTAFFNRPGDRVITTSNTGAYIWNASGNTGDAPLHSFEFGEKVSWATYVFDKASMEDKYIGIASGRRVNVYNINDYSLVWSAEFPSSTNSIEFSSDGKYAVVSSNDGNAIIFETKTGKKRSVCKLKNAQTCRYAQFHPTEQYKIMAVSSNDGIIRFFDLEGNELDSINIKDKEIVAQTQHVTYNNDGTKIAFANISTKELIVLNANTKKELYRLKHPDEEGLILFSNFLSTTSGVEYLLTSATDRTMRRWDAATGLPTEKDAIFAQHINTVNTGVFSFDGKIVLSASNDKTSKIWNLDQRVLQADTTCYLKIRRAKATSKDTVYIGETFINELAIKTIDSIITNICDFKYNIRSIHITGENASDFGIADELEFPFSFAGNANLTLNLFFKPSDIGNRYATIEFVLPTDTIKVTLKGVGTSPGLLLLTNQVDFNSVYVDDVKDTLMPIAVNILNEAIDITEIEIVGINSFNFREFLKDNHTIKANDTLKVPIRFIPFDIGKKSAVLKITHSYNDLKIKLNLLGNGVNISNDTIICKVTDLEGKIGEKIECPIYYKTATNWAKLNLKNIFFNLSFNSSMLFPINESTELKIHSDEIIEGVRKLLISVPYKPGEQTINGLYFLVALGNNDQTELELKNAYCEGESRIFIETESALFKITDICQAGGSRLFDENGKQFLLEQNQPNPATSITEINYEVLEQGFTSLKLYTQTGELIKTFIDKYLLPGKYKIVFETSDLPNGTYFYILKTPTNTSTKTMIIIN